MIQCFVKKEYEAPFGLTQMPRLFSVSRTDEKASAHPRVMHAHDDLVEIVLVRGGESRYFVGGTPYEARRGDLFIFNSRVVHDEPSGPDRPDHQAQCGCCGNYHVGRSAGLPARPPYPAGPVPVGE